jgi:3-methyl-2-oxobutanoate hydroxymethyltransferase
VIERVTISALQQMKHAGRKIVGVVVYDYQMAQITDRAGVDLVSVGDSVGITSWGHQSDAEVTLEQMLLACLAVRRGVRRALVSCDVPHRAMRDGPEAAARAARVLVEQGGADVVKLEAAAMMIRAVVSAGIPVWAQFSPARPPDADSGTDACIAMARELEQAGAAMLDFRHSGPVAGPAVTRAVSIPVLGGLGGGPWLDGRVRALGNAIGNTARALDDDVPRYANVARITLDAIAAYAEDVRSGRHVQGP